MGVPPSELLHRFQRPSRTRCQARKSPIAPVQAQLHTNSIDLAALLPLPTHNEHDSGAYITAGLAIVRNPGTGVQNVSIHRLQINGPDRLGALILPRHTMAYLNIAEQDGHDLPIAIVIGVDPVTLLASQAIAP